MGFYDTSERSRTHGHRLKTAYPRHDFVESGLRYYNSAIGRWNSRDPIEYLGGLHLYGWCMNDGVGHWDYLGLTTPDSILAEFFDLNGTSKLWIMPEDDEYTKKVREWNYVQVFLHSAQGEVRRNCEKWAEERMTDPDWKPSASGGHGEAPSMDENAYIRWTDGTPSVASKRNALKDAWEYYRRNVGDPSNRVIPDNLWYSTIGSFGFFVTVDEIDCCEKKAKLNIWMYNAMTEGSFGKTFSLLFWASAKKPQYMWWNWKEDYDWSDFNDGPSNMSP